MTLEDVVITGVGAISPMGIGFAPTFDRLLTGVGAAGLAPGVIQELVPGAVAAMVPASFDAMLGRADRLLDRCSQLALHAAGEAIRHAALELDDDEKLRAGVYVGVGMGGAATVDAMYSRFYRRFYKVEDGNPTLVHPMTVPVSMANAAASALSMQFGLKGPTATYAVACASSAIALGEAYRAVKYGHADVMIVAGTESLMTPGPYVAWNAMRVLAPADEQDVAASCKPFARDRKGFVLGEGACAMVIESASHARRRGAAVLAQLAGYGTSSDAAHITQPSPEGQARALRAALADAGLAPAQVGYINAHGTATTVGDVAETRAIRDVFGTDAARVAISSTKSMHGHLIGAGGLLEFAIAVEAMRTGKIPPTAYLRESDPECDLDYVPCEARSVRPMEAVLSNSFAFGGTNATLVAMQTPR